LSGHAPLTTEERDECNRDASDILAALKSLTAERDALREEVERLRFLENLMCCAEDDVTPSQIRELCELPDYSSKGRAALKDASGEVG
jgi:uncharacterized coiled-coil DUF342 family protein